jgi:hypothetical protein
MKRTAFLKVAPDAATLTVKVRTRKCAVKGCAVRFTPRSMSHKACGPEHALIVGAAAKAKAERMSDRARREAIKTRPDHIAAAQVAFNAFIRYRDRNEVCISCDTVLSTLDGTPGGGYDAGHYRSRGSAPHLRFDPRNCHGQCKKCNRYKSGNAADYRINLAVRIGVPELIALEAEQGGGKWTIAELVAIKDEYRAKLKALKGQG